MDVRSHDLLILALIHMKVSRSKISRAVMKYPLRIDPFEVGSDAVLDFSIRADLGCPSITPSDWELILSKYATYTSGDRALLSIANARYSKLLRSFPDAPPMLFVRGNMELFGTSSGVAIVGAREATPNGLKIARRISKFAVDNDYVVVSGLALGIDAAAHQSCIDHSGRTIAVLASGVDRPSPQANYSLAMNILERGGAIVSEHPDGYKPSKKDFVLRNRLQVGLSQASVIVEAKVGSGSTTQAKYCIDRKRPLFAVLPQTDDNPLGLLCDGTKEMVRTMGATALRSRDDYDLLVKAIEGRGAY